MEIFSGKINGIREFKHMLIFLNGKNKYIERNLRDQGGQIEVLSVYLYNMLHMNQGNHNQITPPTKVKDMEEVSVHWPSQEDEIFSQY